jgi:hypothetical protein
MALLRPVRSVTPATRRHRSRFAGTASVRSSQCSLKGRRRPLGGVLLLEGLVGSSGFRRAWGLLGQRGRSRPPVRTFRSYAITQLGHALLFGAMGATEDTAIRLYAVADDPASAMSARWCESLDGAFEAVERRVPLLRLPPRTSSSSDQGIWADGLCFPFRNPKNRAGPPPASWARFFTHPAQMIAPVAMVKSTAAAE